ncbi:MAG: hypothetical protein JNL21_09525 [Myxococcales bacterium]|nr:hypothetical protein [Myxococcales bacterium]
MSTLTSVLLAIAWLALQALLAYLVSPPRVELAVRLGPGGKGTTKAKFKTGCVLRIAVQNQAFQTVKGPLVLSIDVGPVGAVLEDEVVGFLGTAKDRDSVRVKRVGALKPARRIEIEIAQIRALKTLVFEIGCGASTADASGELKGKRLSWGQLVTGEPPSGRPLWDFSFNWEVNRDDSLPERGLGPTIQPWGTRFPRRRNRDLRVLVTGLAMAAVTYLLITQVVFGIDDLLTTAGWPSTAVTLGALLGFTTLVFWLVVPKQKPIAQGFFEPCRLQVQDSA